MIKSIGEIENVDYSHILTEQETLVVKKLLKNEPVKHKMGPDDEYEVCTLVDMKERNWHAVCEVRHKGREIEEFPPKYTDYTYQIQNIEEIPEVLQTEFIQEVAAIHCNYCNVIKDYITQRPKRSRSRSPKKNVVLLFIFFLLPVLTGYWLLSTGKITFPLKPDTTGPQALAKKTSPSKPDTTEQQALAQKNSSPKPDNVEWQTLAYKCKRADPCNFGPSRPDQWFQTSKLVQTSNLPKWLTFDKKRFYFNGIVPPDDPKQMYDFLIRTKDHSDNEHILRVKLKVDGPSPSPPMSSAGDAAAGKSVESENIDQEYLLEKLLDIQEN